MYFISDIKKMLSSRIVQITFIFLLVTMLADPISVLIHARRYTGFFENIGANPFQFWLLMNSASWGNKVYNILFWVIPVLATGMLLIRVGETKCFGVILLLAVGYTFLKLSYSPLDSSAFLYRFALGGIIYSLLCFLEITALKKIYMEDWTDYENRCY